MQNNKFFDYINEDNINERNIVDFLFKKILYEKNPKRKFLLSSLLDLKFSTSTLLNKNLDKFTVDIIRKYLKEF